jgi:hypothetical protein
MCLIELEIHEKKSERRMYRCHFLSICSNVCVLQGYGTTRKDMADRPKFSVTVTLWMANGLKKYCVVMNERKKKCIRKRKPTHAN